MLGNVFKISFAAAPWGVAIYLFFFAQFEFEADKQSSFAARKEAENRIEKLKEEEQQLLSDLRQFTDPVNFQNIGRKYLEKQAAKFPNATAKTKFTQIASSFTHPNLQPTRPITTPTVLTGDFTRDALPQQPGTVAGDEPFAFFDDFATPSTAIVKQAP